MNLPQWTTVCPHWQFGNNVITFFNPQDRSVVWESNPGRQTEALWANECEVLYGGARGGGKSQALMAWMVKGNFDLPQDHPCFATVLNHPKFKGLILRRNYTDLREFIDEVSPFYKALGGKQTEDGFKWKNGATIYLGHLADENGVDKYKGWNLARIGVEELTQIKDQKRYLKLLGSCRTPHAELRPKWSDAVGQLFSTTNPDGDGHKWVKNRFVEVLGSGGLIPRGTPMRDPFTGLTRVFIPAKRSDNPKLGSGYDSVLLAQAESDKNLARAWMDGDWNIHSGQYFDIFRPYGPIAAAGDPEHARHVVPAGSVPLMPWWPRYIGVDWGYRHESAVYWVCLNQSDGRLYVYREMVKQGVGSEQLGEMIAKETMLDLSDDCPHIPLFLSHERFNVTDAGPTMADQIAAGMNRVIGAGSVLVTKRGDRENPVTEEYNALMENRARITMSPQGRDRVAGWQHIRNLMQFNETVDLGEPDQEYIRTLMQRGEHVKLEKYLQVFDKRNKRKRPLPALRYFDCCPKLIQQTQDAIHDEREGKRAEDILEDGKEHSNDRLDALRHVMMGIKKREEVVPKREFMAQRLSDLPEDVMNDPTRLHFVTQKASWDYDSKHKSKLQPFSLGRASRPN